MISLLVAAVLTFAEGEVLNHNLSVCIDKKDALEILEVDSTQGEQAGMDLWMKKDGCDNIPVLGYKVGKIVHSAQVKRAGSTVTIRIIEILGDGQVMGYFLTSAPVGFGEQATKRNA